MLIAAQYSGVDLTVCSEPPEFELGKTNKAQDFLAKFPLGKVGGLCIYRSYTYIHTYIPYIHTYIHTLYMYMYIHVHAYQGSQQQKMFIATLTNRAEL